MSVSQPQGGQNRQGDPGRPASGRSLILLYTGGEEKGVAIRFHKADEPSTDILSVHTAGSGLSVKAFLPGREKADGIFNGLCVFRGKVKAVLVQVFQKQDLFDREIFREDSIQ